MNESTNEERSALEVAEFKSNPLPYGKTYRAYLTGPKRLGDKGTIVTFMGDALAYVTRITSVRVTSGFTTDARGSFWATGIDGRTYYGRHNGRGMHCTMRLAKHQPESKP